jgi:hypothetical protein
MYSCMYSCLDKYIQSTYVQPTRHGIPMRIKYVRFDNFFQAKIEKQRFDNLCSKISRELIFRHCQIQVGVLQVCTYSTYVDYTKPVCTKHSIQMESTHTGDCIRFDALSSMVQRMYTIADFLENHCTQ